jgi:hypothetical protein
MARTNQARPAGEVERDRQVLEQELANVREEQREAAGLPSATDNAQGAIIREAQKLATQIIRERDQFEARTSTGKIYSRFDPAADIIENRKETITAGLWSAGSGELNTFHTSSTQTGSNAGKYYWDVYQSSSTSVGSSVQFAIGYGHIAGSGSVINDSDYPTKAIYGQYRNLLLAPGDSNFTMKNSRNANEIYVINIQRSRLKEKLDPGNWELCLSGSIGNGMEFNTGGSAGVLTTDKPIIKLIDDSGASNATITDGKRVYNIVSGTIANGAYTGNTKGYGLVYPDLGVLIMHAGMLREDFGLTGPNNNFGVAVSASGADCQMNRVLFESISGSISPNDSAKTTYGFAARNEEEVTSTFYYVRVKNADYNFSNNPTFTTGSLGALRHNSMVNNPKSYVTSVGLYNDKQELLAVAKLSKPLIKSFDREALIKVKLDF